MRMMLGRVPGLRPRPYVAGLVTGLLLLSPVTAVQAETLEQTYAKLCAGDVKNETCDALRKAMIEKLSGQAGAQRPAAAGAAAPARPAGPSPELVAQWGEVGHWARYGTLLSVSNMQMTSDDISVSSSNTMFVTYRWINPTTIAENHVQVEFVLNGEIQPPQNLTEIDIINTLDPTRGVITRVTTMRQGGNVISPAQTVEMPVTPLKATDYQESVVTGETWYTESTVVGDGKVIRSGKVTPDGRVQITETTQRPAGGVTLAQLRSAAGQRQAQAAQAAAEAAEEDDGDILGAVFSLGLGLAAGEMAGIGADETLGALVQGMEAGDPTAGMASALLGGQGLDEAALAGQLLGGQASGTEALAGQLLSGQLEGSEAEMVAGAVALVGGALAESQGDQPSWPTGTLGTLQGAQGAVSGTAVAQAGGAGSFPTKPNLAVGACTGFTEQNYRTKALEGGGDSQLNTMCGQAFEYYVMYKRAIAQGFSEADANKTYFAHEQSAKVAVGFLRSHGAR